MHIQVSYQHTAPDFYKKEDYMNDHELLMVYGTDYKKMTKKLLEEAKLAERIAGKNSLIGIKPNLEIGRAHV